MFCCLVFLFLFLLSPKTKAEIDVLPLYIVPICTQLNVVLKMGRSYIPTDSRSYIHKLQRKVNELRTGIADRRKKRSLLRKNTRERDHMNLSVRVGRTRY